MRLVDILARELKVWPEYALAITQDQDGETWPSSDLDVTCSGGIWTSNGSFMIGGNILPGKTSASDYSTSIVTRTQWQAAVDALKDAYSGRDADLKALVDEIMDRMPSTPMQIAVESAKFALDQRDEMIKAIRTPEQIAADQRLHEIRNACTAINNKIEPFNTNIDCSMAIRMTIEAMIDAGYRKFEIVDN